MKINLTKKEILNILRGLEYSLDYENIQDKDLEVHNKEIELLTKKIKGVFEDEF